MYVFVQDDLWIGTPDGDNVHIMKDTPVPKKHEEFFLKNYPGWIRKIEPLESPANKEITPAKGGLRMKFSKGIPDVGDE